ISAIADGSIGTDKQGSERDGIVRCAGIPDHESIGPQLEFSGGNTAVHDPLWGRGTLIQANRAWTGETGARAQGMCATPKPQRRVGFGLELPGAGPAHKIQ